MYAPRDAAVELFDPEVCSWLAVELILTIYTPRDAAMELFYPEAYPGPAVELKLTILTPTDAAMEFPSHEAPPSHYAVELKPTSIALRCAAMELFNHEARPRLAVELKLTIVIHTFAAIIGLFQKAQLLVVNKYSHLATFICWVFAMSYTESCMCKVHASHSKIVLTYTSSVL